MAENRRSVRNVDRTEGREYSMNETNGDSANVSLSTVKAHDRTWAWTLANFLCDSFERGLIFFAPPPTRNPFLSGNYSPVLESGPSANLTIEGTLPGCLNGEFMRNGPNPQFAPVSGYHWFDGDGMLHGVRIENGTATYTNRFVQTSRFIQEAEFGAPKFFKLGDLKGNIGLAWLSLGELRRVLKILDYSQGSGVGNTALIFHNRQLLALHEGDAPYAMRILQDGVLETVGRMTYNGALHHSFTAHPKIDPSSGEMFVFGYDLAKKPHLVYRVVSKDGVPGSVVEITLPEPVMIHDFAVTENYAIFLDLNLVFDRNQIGKGLPFVFKPNRAARFGILPRYAASEAGIKWFELPTQFVFHTGNAWEEGDEVVVYACRYNRMDLNLTESFKDVSTLYEYRFNLKTGAAAEKQLVNILCEFPRFNETLLGRKTRYLYCAVYLEGGSKIVGVVKIDLAGEPNLKGGQKEVVLGGAVAGYFSHGPDRSGSEPVFVPNSAEENPEEDDGFLMNFVYDETTKKSEVVIINAKTMEKEAIIYLPTRVPFGFHGIFVSEEDIASQL